ncbi:hypothetical protein T08_11887 [Trichinella sp. T8]|nr:hypothetical protein T08_11887 [Trichinella sp. T8]
MSRYHKSMNQPLPFVFNKRIFLHASTLLLPKWIPALKFNLFKAGFNLSAHVTLNLSTALSSGGTGKEGSTHSNDLHFVHRMLIKYIPMQIKN